MQKIAKNGGEDRKKGISEPHTTRVIDGIHPSLFFLRFI